MISLLSMILAAVLFAADTGPSAFAEGYASQYAVGVMDRVIAYRQSVDEIPDDLSRYDGFVAVMHAADIGREYLIRPVDAHRWERFLAVDCAATNDGTRSWMTRNNVLVEVDAETAERWDTVGFGARVELYPLRPR